MTREAKVEEMRDGGGRDVLCLGWGVVEGGDDPRHSSKGACRRHVVRSEAGAMKAPRCLCLKLVARAVNYN